MKIHEKQLIIDTTLRDGEQAPGIAFSPEQRKHIAKLLAESGVDEIEAGTPAMGEDDISFLNWASGLGVPVSCWCRADLRDIESAKRTGLDGIHISFPVSDRLLKVFGKNRGWVEKAMNECINLCFSDFDRVGIGFMDASRADPEYLGYLIKLSRGLGYDRVRVADTAGVMFPSDVMRLISSIEEPGIAVEFHAHNDLGMATANAVTALESGAGAVSATVLGIGERAGNASLEEVVLAMKLRGCECGVDLSIVSGIAAYISGVCGRAVPAGKPVFGSAAFTHESGIHAAATLADPLSFMPVQPESLGLGKPKISTGRHSGTRSIQHLLSEKALFVDRATASGMLPAVRRMAEETGRELETGELEKIYYEYIKQVPGSGKRALQGLRPEKRRIS